MTELVSPTPVASPDKDDGLPGTRLGIELAAARKRLPNSPSQRDVADELNLSLHTIECLEADQFDDLPPRLFVRGYVSAYAKLLGLSIDQTLRQFDAIYPPKADTPPPAQSTTAPLRMPRSRRVVRGAKSKRRWLRRGVYLVIGAIVIVLAYRWVENGAHQLGSDSLLGAGSSGKAPLILRSTGEH